uniref:Uncharacterized protein n=1 Tax=Triticum urartu TaxID=4572 RepID=A0A8R7JWP9_TRIUA
MELKIPELMSLFFGFLFCQECCRDGGLAGGVEVRCDPGPLSFWNSPRLCACVTSVSGMALFFRCVRIQLVTSKMPVRCHGQWYMYKSWTYH